MDNIRTAIRQNVILQVLLGTIMIFAATQMTIPLKPVPITFHTLAISLVGMLYSPLLAFVTVANYLLLGALGFPMFSNFSSGMLYMSGPTGGYLLGFLISAPFMAYARRYFGTKTIGVLTTILLGHIIIYFFGVSYLSSFVGLQKAFDIGFLIFIPTGLAKAAIFSYTYTLIRGKK